MFILHGGGGSGSCSSVRMRGSGASSGSTSVKIRVFGTDCIGRVWLALWPAASPGAPRQSEKTGGLRSELEWLERESAGLRSELGRARLSKPAVGNYNVKKFRKTWSRERQKNVKW